MTVLYRTWGSHPYFLPCSEHLFAFRRRIWTGFLGCEPCPLLAMKVTVSKMKFGTCRRSWNWPWVWSSSCQVSWQNSRSRSVCTGHGGWVGWDHSLPCVTGDPGTPGGKIMIHRDIYITSCMPLLLWKGEGRRKCQNTKTSLHSLIENHISYCHCNY